MRIFNTLRNIIISINGTLVLLFLILLFFNSTNEAQQKNLRFKRLSYEDGLPSTTVNKVMEDANGFVWFACTGGLARYDGYDMLTFSPRKDDSTSIGGIIINDLYEDHEGIIWIGLMNGLNSYNPKIRTFTKYKNNLSPSEKLFVLSISESDSSEERFLLVGTRENGLLKFYPNRRVFEKVIINTDENKILEVRTVISINKTSKGIFWIATHSNGLLKYNPQKNSFTQFSKSFGKIKIGDNHINRTIFSENFNKLFIGTGNYGLNILDEEAEKVDLLANCLINPSSNLPYRILAIKEIGKEIWISTVGGGLFVFNPTENIFTQYLNEKENPTSISGNVVNDIYQTRSGVVFLATNDNEISIYNPDIERVNSIVHSPRNMQSLTSNEISSVVADNEGNLWIATIKGLNKYNIKTKRNERIKSRSKNIDLSNIMITKIIESRINKNIFWLGTYGKGILKFNKTSKMVESFGKNENLYSTTIETLTEDKLGNLWIGTSGHGLKVFNTKTNSFVRLITEQDSIKQSSKELIISMAVAEDSTVWFGSIGGLKQYSLGKEKLTTINLFDGTEVSDQIITSLLFSKNEQNILWVGTASNGLIKYNFITKRKIQYTENEGLPNNTIIGIVEIKNGNLWMSTNNGVSEFNPNNETFQNYTSEDGFLLNTFNISAACSAGDSILCFGSSKGLNYFNPNVMQPDTSKPKAILTDLLLFNQKVEVSDSSVLNNSIDYLDELILNYSDYIFSIKFTAPNFKNPHKFRYAYKLDGFNEDWIYTSSKNRMATFTNIPHGEYEFRVKVANSAGIWNENYTSIKIIITPPFWKTWWAYTFYILFFGLVLFTYIRWRVRHAIKEQKRLEKLVAERTKELEELNDNKDRFFSIVAHDIKTPIIAVLKFSKILKNQYAILSEEERLESISDIHDWLGVCYRYLTNLLDWSRLQMGKFIFKPQNIPLKNVVDAAVMVQESQAELKEIKLKTEIDENIIVFADYEMILVVLSNLISNAIKFSEKFNEVTIVAEMDLDRVQVLIKDNGIGIDPEDLSELFNVKRKMKPSSRDKERGTGLGLILSKELIEKNNGDIKVESILGKGTTMTFQLPKGKEVNG